MKIRPHLKLQINLKTNLKKRGLKDNNISIKRLLNPQFVMTDWGFFYYFATRAKRSEGHNVKNKIS